MYRVLVTQTPTLVKTNIADAMFTNHQKPPSYIPDAAANFMRQDEGCKSQITMQQRSIEQVACLQEEMHS